MRKTVHELKLSPRKNQSTGDDTPPPETDVGAAAPAPDVTIALQLLSSKNLPALTTDVIMAEQSPADLIRDEGPTLLIEETLGRAMPPLNRNQAVLTTEDVERVQTEDMTEGGRRRPNMTDVDNN